MELDCCGGSCGAELHSAWQVRCGVAGSSDLLLSLTATCADAQPEPGNVTFQASVGASDTKLISLSNTDSVLDWHVRPVIRNSQWSGSDMVIVPAGLQHSYELTYKPISQSTQVSINGQLSILEKGPFQSHDATDLE